MYFDFFITLGLVALFLPLSLGILNAINRARNERGRRNLFNPRNTDSTGKIQELILLFGTTLSFLVFCHLTPWPPIMGPLPWCVTLIAIIFVEVANG